LLFSSEPRRLRAIVGIVRKKFEFFRLREGESSIVGGFIRDEARGSIKGIPLLSKLPIIGRLFGSSEDTIRQTDVIFSITPRFIREVKANKESRETIWSDTGHPAGVLSNQEGVPEENSANSKPVRSERTNSVMITPSSVRVQINSSSMFVIRMNSGSDISTLSVSGTITGGKVEIEVRLVFRNKFK